MLFSYFNPRSHERSDDLRRAASQDRQFQSTLPREERLLLNILQSSYAPYFNPRSHERSDSKPITLPPTVKYISIHAPTRGATRIHALLDKLPKISIHAPTRGATCAVATHTTAARISIHAPTRGATKNVFLMCRMHLIFQSTLPREERPMPFTFFTRFKYFNPRSHERSDKYADRVADINLNFNPRSHERSDKG